MPINDLFSKRQKRMRSEIPDVYRYDIFPRTLRGQVAHIIHDALGNPKSLGTIESYKHIHHILCREYGLFSLIEESSRMKIKMNSENHEVTEKDEVTEFLLEDKDIEHILDVIELTFQLINNRFRDASVGHQADSQMAPDEAVNELNSRFREHGVGYQFEAGEICRVDSQFIHSEAVQPALRLLSDKRFEGANEEFLKAHEHYRHERYEESIVECLKAFESTMKSICDNQGWSYDQKDAVKRLIDVCFKNNLVPNYLQDQFTSLQKNLETGIPTIRNKNAGHGQGSEVRSVPSHFAAYQLHMTASTIFFLIESEKSLS